MVRKNSRAGFTMIELMVVLLILGLMATLVGPKILGRVDDAKITKAKSDMKAMESGLKLYKLDTGSYPTTEQGLKALIELPTTDPIPRGWKPGGYLEVTETPLDPWEMGYIYRSPTDVEGRDYEIISFGSDKKEGGDGINADIKSYELK